ncbi:hypothetical protein NA57DRAFT_82132 [Rhizodiscina lignyota]|uniref:Uncharacterized protein n=1 Tax=Rhizodiscina lignyota TaxID=1504668 RepID=A0A9P4I2S5_9PEZI|nr:hypothetical protein NA57DRAFT_82132 [Rhizodiscina lignyota]
MVLAIWPDSNTITVEYANESGDVRTGLLRTFIRVTLELSKPTFSTFLTALYYLILVNVHVIRSDNPAMEEPKDNEPDDDEVGSLQAGPGMFITALILAFKYNWDSDPDLHGLQAWSRSTGLSIHEIKLRERAFLRAISWKLFIPEATFRKWQNIVLGCTLPIPIPIPSYDSKLRVFIASLNPNLEGYQGPLLKDTAVEDAVSLLRLT